MVDVRFFNHRTVRNIQSKLLAMEAGRALRETMSEAEFEEFLEGARKSAREDGEPEADIEQVFGSPKNSGE